MVKLVERKLFYLLKPNQNQHKVNVLILDDEKRSREVLAEIITKYCPEIINIIRAHSVQSAYEILQQQEINLVFLDIEMPNESGFDLLRKFDSIDFEVIFVTAYEEYAITAIRFGALDYLLKPISVFDLKKAISRAVKKIINKEQSPRDQLDFVQRALEMDTHKIFKIPVHNATGIEFIDTQLIVRCEAQDNYTKIYLKDERHLITARTLKEYESLLSNWQFFRVHRSHLINLQMVKQYKKGKTSTVLLKDGTEVELSNSRRATFLKVMNSF